MGMRRREFHEPRPDLSVPTFSGEWQAWTPWWGWDPPVTFTGTVIIGNGPGWSHTIVDDLTHKKVRGRYLDGGPFHLRRVVEKSLPVSISGAGNKLWGGAVGRWEIGGHTYAIWHGNPPLPEMPSSGEQACASYGAQAWNRFKPGAQQASAAVFLAELRDLPSMLQLKSYQHYNAGGHYLSYQFGWKPFVQDLRKMINLFDHLDREVSKLAESSGKSIRRTGTVRNSSEHVASWECGPDHLVVFSPMPHFQTEKMYSYGCRGELTRGEKVWFNATFKFHIPELPAILTNRSRINKMKRQIMGLSLTPANVWSALPWSWLADYFGNIGDVLSNLSIGAIGDVTSTNAFIMRHAWERASQVSYGELSNDNVLKGSIECVAETKDRMQADPFGFGLSTDLSGRQLAILAALGLARA